LRQSKMEIQSNISLNNYSTYRTGGKADFLCECKDKEDMIEALCYAKNNNLDYIVIGGGSNILVSDKGYRGLVMANKIGGIEIEDNKVTVGAGVPMPKLILMLQDIGLSGLEFMAGIPGTVGGAIMGNAGAWKHEISENLVNIVVIDNEDGIREIKSRDITFSYRKSNFQESDYIITAATFKLKKKESALIKEETIGYLKKKIKAQPKGLYCGSYFKNPKEKPAGMIIEELVFKGKKVGGAEVSEKHANFIINTGNATSKDIYDLSLSIKNRAKEKLGIDLIEEVKLIGDF
jgi:UDP-N-acetylmuramate dehydrogenase